MAAGRRTQVKTNANNASNSVWLESAFAIKFSSHFLFKNFHKPDFLIF